jgi:outer membrane protein assembly factor BamB
MAMASVRWRTARAVPVGTIAWLAACGSLEREADRTDAGAAVDATAGPRVAFVAPRIGGEHRGGIRLELTVESPGAGLREAGVELAGHREVLCSDVAVVAGLHCNGGLELWDLGIAAGVYTLRAFAIDDQGRTATAEREVAIRPYRRPRWEWSPEYVINAPALAGERLLVPADRLYALRADDGALLWSLDPRRGGDFDHVRGVVADGERAYITAGVAGADQVIGVDLATGAALWKAELFNAVLSAPVLDGAGNVVVAGSDSDLTAFDRDGTQLWRVDLDNNGDRVPVRAPVVAADGTLYQHVQGRDEVVRVDTAGRILRSFRLVPDYHNGIAVGPDGVLYASDDDGVRAYRPDGSGWLAATAGHVTRPVRFGADGRIYAAAERVGALVLDADGATLWTATAPGFITGTPFEAPDGSIYIGAKNGRAYLHDVGGARLDEFPYCDQPDSFVAGRGLVFCASYGRIYAIDPAKRSE